MSEPTRTAVRDQELGAHLLRRFGLGASENELEFFLQDGYSGAVDRLLSPLAAEEPDPFDLDEMRSANGQLQPRAVAAWWTLRLLTTRRPLLERMTLFWHNHFATGADKVASGPMMARQNETIRANALGRFDDLLVAIAKDPAMLLYLDNQLNVKGKPNENFARELMELFTLGIGNYTERDVLEAARCFTGWSIKRNGSQGKPEFIIRDRLHDGGVKTVLGRSGKLTGDDVLALLCAREPTATFLTTKLWNWFVYPDPTPQVIAPFAKRFLESGLDITALLRMIMLSSEFQSDRARRHIVKSPIDFCVVTLRQLGIGNALVGTPVGVTKPTRAKVGISAATTNAMRTQGMWLLYPPDVSGWKPGNAWITTATMIERTNWAARIFGQTGNNRIPTNYSTMQLFGSGTTPLEIVDRFASVFDVVLKPDQRPLLAKAAELTLAGKPLSSANANKVSTAVCRLMFSLPEFQMS